MLKAEHRVQGTFSAAIVLIALVATACSAISESSVESSAPPTTAESLVAMASSTTASGNAASTTTEPASTPSVVEVTAKDYAFVGIPATVDAGARIQFINESVTELHEFVAIRLPDDETRSVEELVQLPIDELDAFFSLVETVILASPGGRAYPAVGTGRLDEPGRYAIICAIPIAADPNDYLQAVADSEGRPEFEGGPPHYAAGMWGVVTVDG